MRHFLKALVSPIFIGVFLGCIALFLLVKNETDLSITLPEYCYRVYDFKEQLWEWERVHGVDKELLAAIMCKESAGRVKAKNPRSGATGLFQIIPGWHEDCSDLFNPDKNVECAVSHLKECYSAPYGRMSVYNWNNYNIVKTAVACYHGGYTVFNLNGGRVSSIKPEREWNIITRNYVRDVMGWYEK